MATPVCSYSILRSFFSFPLLFFVSLILISDLHKTLRSLYFLLQRGDMFPQRRGSTVSESLIESGELVFL